MRSTTSGMLAMAMALAGATACLGSIVFDNGNHVSDGRWASDNGFGGSNRVADDFMLPTTTSITDVHWKGLYRFGEASADDDFTVRIFADNGAGQPTPPTPPGTEVYAALIGDANRTATGEFISDSITTFTVYGYSANIAPFVALANVPYWLEIFNNSTADIWYWSLDLNAGNGVSTEQTTSWVVKRDEFTFQLTDNAATGVVPEAASLTTWAIIFGLSLIVGARVATSGR